jgi:hypothetical protein
MILINTISLGGNEYVYKVLGETNLFNSAKNLSEFGGNFPSSWKYLDAAAYNGDSNI